MRIAGGRRYTTHELAYVAAIQLLPPRQRAVLILRDVLGWSASETAQTLDLTAPAANSALQRAHTRMREQLPQRRLDWSTVQPTAQERDLLLRFIDVHERADVAALISLMREDIRVTMPPHPWCYVGLDTLAPLLERAIGRDSVGDWRLVPTSANRQPSAASYLRGPTDPAYQAFKLDVLRSEAGKISEITTFDANLFPAFGLPQTLS